MDSIWILTEEYNDYDQHGEYFIAAFAGEVTKEKLLKAGVKEFELAHVLNGGGRKKEEYQWYNLNKVALIA